MPPTVLPMVTVPQVVAPNPTPVPDGPLDGKFSVSTSKKVFFSPGNLQATYNGTSWSWNFAANEYDFIGNAAGNTSVTNASPWINGTGTVDLFGYSTSSNYYGINSSTSDYDYTESFVDWGTLSIGSYTANTWRTLTKEEWNYLFQTRTDHQYKHGEATVAGVQGWVIVPDNWMVPDGCIFNSDGDRFYDWGWDYNVYTSEQWEIMKTSGAVFLPAASYRNGTTVEDFGVHDSGCYRSSDGSDYVHFDRDGLNPNMWGNVCEGHSVRLVRDAE